ncbi:MAG: type II toxin-antitoxin system RelE/ParE family toxin [Acetobacter sp.]|nr:type II toxin-antitoxin system RelE/ParE family toxin [Acetobacter sp.]
MTKYTIEQTDTFEQWFDDLRDKNARSRITKRLRRVEEGNFGDHKNLGGGISELRFKNGPGYRLYYTERKGIIVILLVGGDKSTQSRDIEKARELAKEWSEE